MKDSQGSTGCGLEEAFRFLAENTSDIIVRADMEGRLVYVSPACRRYGYEPEDLVGQPTGYLTHPDDLPHLLDNNAALMAGEPPRPSDERQHRFRAKNGDWIWMEGNPRIVYDAEGQPESVINVFRDVTWRRAQEEALRQSEARARLLAEQAEAATAAKSQFLANMSHEIRTPLTAVLGFTGLLAGRENLDEEARRYVERIGAASRGLLAVVNDILDFSKLEAGQFEIRPRPTDAAAEGEETALTFQAQAEAKGLALAFERLTPIPPSLELDGDRLRQILLNLVGNAVKFTEAGVVTVAMSYQEHREVLEVRVTDTGPGLDADQQARLFQRFSQVDGSATRKHEGTGLGLAICRGLALAMGGEVGVESEPGRGSSFFLRLPAPPAETFETGDEDLDLSVLAGLAVLVTDDNAVNRELARALLEVVGMHVSEAVDGEGAVALCAALPFDLVLMDMRMPGKSGDQALAEIRAQMGPNHATPILAFTANADMESCDAAALTAFNGVVRKPIGAAELFAALVQAVAWRGAAERAA